MNEAEDADTSIATVKQQDRHSYPPVVAASVVAGSGAQGGNKGEVNNDTATIRPSTRASSYATANESDDDEGPPTATSIRRSASSHDGQPHTATTMHHDGNHTDQAQGHDECADNAEDSSDSDSEEEATPSSPTNTMTPAAQLRLSLARRLWNGVTQLRSRSRCALLFQGAFTIAQIAAFITLLALSAKQTCIKPLRVFIALHVARIAVAYPVSFYNAIAPPSRPPRGEEDTPESRERREARRVIGNPRLDARLRTASDLISLFSFVWFFLGNVWLYSSGECKATSPYMWWSSLTILIIAYIRVAELAIIILAVVFFLPLVIVVLRLFGGLEKKHEVGPLTKDEIAKLPIVYYIPAPSEQTEKPATGSTAESGAEKPTESRTEHSTSPGDALPTEATDKKAPDGETALKSPRRRRHFVRLLFKRKRAATQSGDALSKAEAGQAINGPYVPTKYPLHPLPDNLSSCPICLSDYEPPPLLTAPPEERDKALEELEPLTLLPCGHSIHKDCLAPWLQTSGRCPVCQRAVLGEGAGQQKKSRLGLRRRRHRRRQPSTHTGDHALTNVDASVPPSATRVTQDRPSASTVPPLPV